MKLVKLVNVKRRTFNGVKFGKTVNVQEENVALYLRSGFELVAKVTEQTEAEKKKAEKDAKAQAKKDAKAQKKADAQAKKQADLDAEYEEKKGDDKIPDLEEKGDDNEDDAEDDEENGDDALDLDEDDAEKDGLDAELEK